RIILDSTARTPLTAQLIRTAREIPTLIATTSAAPASQQEALQATGCEVLALPAAEKRVSVAALLAELGRRRMTNVLIGGGAEVLGSFLDAGTIDEVHVFVAPLLVGGAEAHTPLTGQGVARIADGLRLARWDVEMCEGDVYLHGYR